MKDPLWTRNFALITAATALGAAGGIAGGFALSFFVFDETGSTLASALVLAVTNGVGSGYAPLLAAFFRTAPGFSAGMYSLFSAAEFLGRTLGGTVQYRLRLPAKKKFGFAFGVYQFYEMMDICLLWLPYPLMLANRACVGFLGANSAAMRQAAVQRYLPDRLRARVNALEEVLFMAAGCCFSLVLGALGEALDRRLCVSLAAGFALVSCWLTIWKSRRDVRAVYEAQA